MADISILGADGGVLKTVQTDADTIRFASTQDVDPIIQYAREMAEAGGWSSEMKPAAEIPMVIVEKMMQDGSWGDPAAMKAWLNDPQNKCFRIWQGRL